MGGLGTLTVQDRVPRLYLATVMQLPTTRLDLRWATAAIDLVVSGMI